MSDNVVRHLPSFPSLTKQFSCLLLFLTTATCWSQVKATGKVIFQEDKSAAQGVSVLEKGTRNGTVTQSDGTFQLLVTSPRAVLVFSFVGAVTEEVQLDGRNDILVALKLDCNKDFFDSRQVALYVNSGLINNPVGGLINVSSPWILHGVVKASYSYQTNVSHNTIQVGQIELTHYISNCDFDMDFRWASRRVEYNNTLEFRVNSIEGDLNLGSTKLTAGYSHLDLNNSETAEQTKQPGVVVGVSQIFNGPVRQVTLKAGVYKERLEYQLSLQGGYKRFAWFLKYYKLDEFQELSLGVGAGFGYHRKKRQG